MGATGRSRCPHGAPHDWGVLGTPGDWSLERPWEALEPLREQGGDVAWSPELNAWMVSSYDACKEIARGDGTTWQKVYRPAIDRDSLIQFWGAGTTRGITYIEDDEERNSAEHTRLHRWWIRAFSPRQIARWRETVIRPLIDDQIDRFVEAGRVELVDALAGRVPSRVIAGTMGLPTDDESIDRLMTLQYGITGLRALTDATSDERIAHANRCSELLTEQLLPHVEARRAGTAEDFISLLWRDADEIFDPGWDIMDIVANVRIMFQAGSETTVNGTCNALYMVLTEPELRAGLLAGGKPAVGHLVEETLRLYSPVVVTLRRANEELVIGGQRIARGDVVFMVVPAAGRDERHYECPHQVDLDRTSPRDHLAFHFGPRACTGQFLARADMEELLIAVLDRLPDVRLDETADPPRYIGAWTARRWEPLHAVFTPRRAVAVAPSPAAVA